LKKKRCKYFDLLPFHENSKLCIQLGLRYCGGCNPEIDRPGLIDHLKEGIERRGITVEFITDKETATDLIPCVC